MEDSNSAKLQVRGVPVLLAASPLTWSSLPPETMASDGLVGNPGLVISKKAAKILSSIIHELDIAEED